MALPKSTHSSGVYAHDKSQVISRSPDEGQPQGVMAVMTKGAVAVVITGANNRYSNQGTK